MSSAGTVRVVFLQGNTQMLVAKGLLDHLRPI